MHQVSVNLYLPVDDITIVEDGAVESRGRKDEADEGREVDSKAESGG